MASKSWLNFLIFLCGSAVGFVLCSQLFSILLGEQGDTQPKILHNDPHAGHSDDIGQNHLEGQMNFNADASQHKGMDYFMKEYFPVLNSIFQSM